jgi:hypothetical protein
MKHQITIEFITITLAKCSWAILTKDLRENLKSNANLKVNLSSNSWALKIAFFSLAGSRPI